MNVCVCEWERTHLLICVYEWERKLTSLPPFRPITRRTNLLANRILDEWTDPDTPKRIPWHWHWGIPDTKWYPLHWVIPIMDTPKMIPITLSDTDTLSDFSSHWQFSQLTQEFTHYTEGLGFSHKQTGHWMIPMTLKDTLDTEWYPLP